MLPPVTFCFENRFASLQHLIPDYSSVAKCLVLRRYVPWRQIEVFLALDRQVDDRKSKIIEVTAATAHQQGCLRETGARIPCSLWLAQPAKRCSRLHPG